MIKLIVMIYLITLYISLPGLINKAGYKFYYGLIPIVNIYYLFKALKLHPVLIIIFSLLLIICPFRELFATMFIIFLPFMISDAYNSNLMYGFLGLLIPFIIFPITGYLNGVYQYGGDEDVLL